MIHPNSDYSSKLLALRTRLNSLLGRQSQKADRWLANMPLFVDTETTGLDENAQIIEIALVDASEYVYFQTRLKPTVSISPEASNVHGITDADLIDAPSWPDVATQLNQMIKGRQLIAFNSDFDQRLIIQTAQAFGDQESVQHWQDTGKFQCAMKLAAETYPDETNRYGTISLDSAIRCARTDWPGTAHSAVVDATATVRVVQAIANFHKPLQTEINQITAFSQFPDYLSEEEQTLAKYLLNKVYQPLAIANVATWAETKGGKGKFMDVLAWLSYEYSQLEDDDESGIKMTKYWVDRWLDGSLMASCPSSVLGCEDEYELIFPPGTSMQQQWLALHRLQDIIIIDLVINNQTLLDAWALRLHQAGDEADTMAILANICDQFPMEGWKYPTTDLANFELPIGDCLPILEDARQWRQHHAKRRPM